MQRARSRCTFSEILLIGGLYSKSTRALTFEYFSRHVFRAMRLRPVYLRLRSWQGHHTRYCSNIHTPVYLGLRSWQGHHTRYSQTLSLCLMVFWKVYARARTHTHAHTHTGPKGLKCVFRSNLDSIRGFGSLSSHLLVRF